jgi:serine-type D-Ala-D-Ala carboxypeptidase (penicillin-binding protein 5/6)
MKRYKRNSLKRLFKVVMLQLFLFSIIIIGGKSLYEIAQNKEVEISQSRAEEPIRDITPIAGNVELITDEPYLYQPLSPTSGISDDLDVDLADDRLFSRNVILMRLSDRKVLFEKSSNEIIYPASLTKIMTAIVAIEKLDNPDDPIDLPSDIFQKLYDDDASMAGFLPGETASALDLLYGVLLPSGAECCVGLSDYIAGSETDFVTLMNQKAGELGMKSTHFTNSTGLSDTDHYTTVTDLSILLEYALENDSFREIFTSSEHSTSPTNLHPGGITFYSTMFKNMVSPDFDGGSILGGKTGYTSEAGLCLASLASINSIEYILITTGAKGNHKTEQYNIDDALSVYESLK